MATMRNDVVLVVGDLDEPIAIARRTGAKRDMLRIVELGDPAFLMHRLVTEYGAKVGMKCESVRLGDMTYVSG